MSIKTHEVIRYGVFGVVLATVLARSLQAQSTATELPPPVQMSAVDDIKRLAALVNVEPILTRPSYKYDEATANPFPNLPDPLLLKNGQKVTDAQTWWDKRRPEILEDFEQEVYGHTPRNVPKVTWEVTSTTEGKNGDVPIVTKTLVGHVDNSSYPLVTVNIQAVLITPANAAGPVPVMIQFSGFGFGFPGGRGPASGPTLGRGRGAATNPALARGRGPASAPGLGLPPGPTWQQQLLAKGWGYALLNTASVQADNGAGLTQGIIGLANKGQPRKADDWGVLAAWAWGASRVLDYLETDRAVDAKKVGLEGHSRWGKATIVGMAFDQRFAIAYVSSSGEGGARLHRRDYGQPLDAVTIPEEYHWMAGNFLKYSHRHWDQLPVDSHELIALCAPRPVLITGGTYQDRGVDAKGMFLAAVAAGPVYKLLGKNGLGTTEMPQPNVALIDGDVAFRQHEGGHSDAFDWPTFIEFASRYFK
ncbi:MAG TPA: hypothetical protein VHD56_17805 [Tepidisphaeraceae bacterium]|nr:hypothetical protein [Tepidisphaeraceae bacterium]